MLLTGALLCFSLTCREGAIDRLVGIYKDVVHNTGVSVNLAYFTVRSLILSGFELSVCASVLIGLPHRKWVCQPRAS